MDLEYLFPKEVHDLWVVSVLSRDAVRSDRIGFGPYRSETENISDGKLVTDPKPKYFGFRFFGYFSDWFGFRIFGKPNIFGNSWTFSVILKYFW